MSEYCDDCGCKVYSGACTNCHEEVYIADQHLEFGTYGNCSDEFKDKVESQERDIARKQSLHGF